MLGIGLEFNRATTKTKYILDKLGLLSNLIVGVSLYKLTNTYNGYCLRIRRSSDGTTKDIGFKSGFWDYQDALTFVGANNGTVNIFYNQIGSSNYVQNTSGNQPVIISTGVVLDGLLFTNKFMNMPTPSNMSTITNKYTLYSKVKPLGTSNGWLFTVNTDSSANVSIGCLIKSSSENVVEQWVLGSNRRNCAITYNSYINLGNVWDGSNLKNIVNSTSQTFAYSTPLLSHGTWTMLSGRSGNSVTGDGSSVIPAYIKTLILLNKNISDSDFNLIGG